jgi:hypothetical protein
VRSWLETLKLWLRGYQGLRKLASALHVIEDFTLFKKEQRQCASLETILQTTLKYVTLLLPLESFQSDGCIYLKQVNPESRTLVMHVD